MTIFFFTEQATETENRESFKQENNQFVFVSLYNNLLGLFNPTSNLEEQ